MDRDIRLPNGAMASLGMPERPIGLVVFAHGSGSSRWSPRNRRVAATLRAGGLATLLVDLLTSEEEALDAATGALRFDIGLLADRIRAVTEWLIVQPATRSLHLGYFGSSTGAAAALVAAAEMPEIVSAVVSRGGRPDLAGPVLAEVRAPTLLVVGGADEVVLELNREALARLRCPKQLVVIPGATHLFEEPGALERVAELARDWFTAHLAPLGEQPERPAP